MDKEFLDEIRTRLPLSQVVGKSVRLKPKGHEQVGLSPFNKEKTPSFYVSDEKGVYYCFSSGKSGDMFNFIMEMENLSFMEAVEKLAHEAGLQMPKQDPQAAQRAKVRQSLYEPVEAAARWYHENLFSADGREALEYLRKRGLNDEMITRFRIGYAPKDGGALRDFLKSRHFHENHAIEAGLLRRSDRGGAPYGFFRDRIIFPVSDHAGRTVAFGGRLISGDGPKYINTSETPLFKKGSLLYGAYECQQYFRNARYSQIILVEGYMDVIALHQAGFVGALAPLGTAMTQPQLQRAWALAPHDDKNPIICFDGDRAGQAAAIRAVERVLPLLQPDHSAKAAFLPEGEDPDSLIQKSGRAALERVLDGAMNLSDLLWHLARQARPSNTPEAKAGLKKHLLDQIATIENESVRKFYTDDLYRRLRPPRQYGKQQTDNITKRTRPNSGQRIREKIAIKLVLTHPEFLDEIVEEFAALPFTDPDFDHMRQRIMHHYAHDPDLDSGGLRMHLEQDGYIKHLADIDDPSLSLHAGFLKQASSHEEQQEGWDNLKKLWKAA